MPNNNTGNGNSGSSEDPLRDLRMPSVGPSPSTFTDDAISSREPTEEKEELVDDDDDEDDLDEDEDRNNDLRTRLNLPPGVTAAESCRSASPGDGMTSYGGDR